MLKYYSGIGSRTTPSDVCQVMTEIATNMENAGYVLRSGAAPGADAAFEAGVRQGSKQIWDPRSALVAVHPWAIQEIRKHCHEFPFDKMTEFVQNLLVRNMYQILGEDGKSPVNLVICWTINIDPCHKDSGGTRYAARCAAAHGIRIDNLRNPQTLKAYIERNIQLRK